jgi:hypothetical protein
MGTEMGKTAMFRIVNHQIALIELSAWSCSGIAALGWIGSRPEPTLADSAKRKATG